MPHANTGYGEITQPHIFFSSHLLAEVEGGVDHGHVEMSGPEARGLKLGVREPVEVGGEGPSDGNSGRAPLLQNAHARNDTPRQALLLSRHVRYVSRGKSGGDEEETVNSNRRVQQHTPREERRWGIILHSEVGRAAESIRPQTAVYRF